MTAVPSSLEEPVRAGSPAAGRGQAHAALAFSALLFGLQFVLVRRGVTTDFNAYDLASLRFAVAGLLMLPFFIRLGWRDCAGIGWGRGLALAMLGGPPILILSNVGLTLAPAVHGACMQPGVVSVFTVIYAALVTRSWPSRPVILSLGVVLLGLSIMAMGGVQGAGEGPGTLIGDVFFVMGGALWAGFTWVGHRWKVPPLTAAAVVAVLSLVWLPIHALLLPSKLATAPIGMIAFQGLYQGVGVLILGIVAWNFGVARVGTAVGSRYSALVPVVGFVLAIPVAGEWPTPAQDIGMAVIVAGLFSLALRR